jgi:hypothetical protein
MTINYIKDLDWHSWLYGLVSAAIGGGAGAATAGFTAIGLAPDTFNLEQPGLVLKLAAISFAVNAILSVFLYLKQSPLPKVEE